MRFIHRKRENLSKMLTEVYRQKQQVPVDDQWQAEVLRRARLTGHFQRGRTRGVQRRFQLPIRQLIPATGVALAILLAIAVYVSGPGNKSELVAMNDPLEVVVAQLFWP